ncbi:MAG: polymer-forming cytoskeletal protein, partial [Bacteroidales bacterium]|nr:polymer-forming cytoskeletal protein [Bacteroidales bacterium]
MAKNNNIVVNPNVINQICIETEIQGNIITKGDIRIDGVLTGNLTTTGKLVLGETGRIHGEVFCTTGHISGTIEGKINNKEVLSLKSTASIVGDINTDKLAIEPGAK